MKRYSFIGVFFLLCLYGISFAEAVDITKNLQQNIKSQPQAPLKSAINPPVPPVPSGQSIGDEADAMTDIYDIKSLEKIGYDKRIIKYGIILLIVILLIGLLFYLIDYFIRRRKKEKIEEIVIIPADIEAYDLLEELKKNNVLEAREYYFRLTSILRGYMGRRFEIDAPEMTTEELLPQINDLDFEKILKFNLKSLLTSTDPVKFAGVGALKEKMDDDYKTVKDFIKQTPLETIDSEEE